MKIDAFNSTLDKNDEMRELIIGVDCEGISRQRPLSLI